MGSIPAHVLRPTYKLEMRGIASGPVAQWIRHRPTEPGIAGSSPAEIIAFHRANGCCRELRAHASCEDDARLVAPQHAWRAGAMPHAVGGLRMRGGRSRIARATPTSAKSWSRARARSNKSVTRTCLRTSGRLALRSMAGCPSAGRAQWISSPSPYVAART